MTIKKIVSVKVLDLMILATMLMLSALAANASGPNNRDGGVRVFDLIVSESKVLVVWDLISDADNIQLLVEKSEDGEHYETLAIDELKNYSEESNYTLLDENPYTGWSFYKITVSTGKNMRGSITREVYVPNGLKKY